MKYQLIPTNGRKSFWGKAEIEISGKWETLLSYKTPIIRKNTVTGALERIYEPEPSCTTCSHIKSFCGLNKTAFMKMPVKS